MHRIIYLDPEIIQHLKASASQPPDPELVEAVNDALEGLDSDLQQIVHERYFEGLTVPQIAERNKIPENEVVKLIYEAKRQLKMMLAEFVRKRWGLQIKGVCKICTHPQKEKINSILQNKKDGDSWREICSKIEAEVGDRIYPPQILKAHIKHINRNITGRIQDER